MERKWLENESIFNILKVDRKKLTQEIDNIQVTVTMTNTEDTGQDHPEVDRDHIHHEGGMETLLIIKINQNIVFWFKILLRDAGTRHYSTSYYSNYSSWQDLKDFVRKETKIETAFCQAHRDNVGEGLGKPTVSITVITVNFSCISSNG